MLYYGMPTRHFVGVDPGGTTGFAALSYPQATPPVFVFWQAQTPSPWAHDIGEIARQLARPHTEVVIEDFKLVANASRGASAAWGLQPVAITAALQATVFALWEITPDQWFFQTASQAKSFMPDHRLRSVFPEIERYTKGMPHARDAARHVLTHLARRHPALYQAAKGATPDPAKYLQTPHKRRTRTRAC